MCDEENEKSFMYSDDDDDDEEDEERYIALPAAKCRDKEGILLKQRRQKFCPKWERAFPWLKPDNIDESIGLCTVCNKRLVCKKSHLERHQKSYKHQRCLGFEDVPLDTSTVEGYEDDAQPTAPEFLECGKQEPEDDEFDNAIEMDPGYSMDYDEQTSKPIKQESLQTKHTSVRRISKTGTPSSSKLNRFKLLKRIDRDRQELNDYYYARRKDLSPTPGQHSSNPRDSFDLFFESVSASVKTLPPKLASEVKIRVSQIIAEFELRAICEREGLKSPGSADGSTMVVASTTHDIAGDITHRTSADASAGMPQILYTFHPKIGE